MKTLPERNVCAIRVNNQWWQNNTEHGAGWTDRIRQTWTAREAMIEFMTLETEFNIDGRRIEVIEMIPGEQVPYEREVPKVDWTKPIQYSVDCEMNC